jgi:hypothetical protein
MPMTIVERTELDACFKGCCLVAGAAYPQIGRGRASAYCASRSMKWLSKNRFISGPGPDKLLAVVFAIGPPALATYLSEPSQ